MAETAQATPQREISRGMVAIYKEYFGRGPTQVQTTICDTFVLVVLRDALTKVEQRLAREENSETVRSIRRKFQTAMSREIVELVERVTGRRGASFLSDHDVESDVAIELVLFENDQHSSD